MNYVDEDIKMNILIKDKGTLLANANISIRTSAYGFITIKGFQIWKSRIYNERLKDNINITPPTKVAYGRAIYFIYFEHREKWAELEFLIYTHYQIARSKDAKIDIDKIPV